MIDFPTRPTLATPTPTPTPTPLPKQGRPSWDEPHELQEPHEPLLNEPLNGSLHEPRPAVGSVSALARADDAERTAAAQATARWVAEQDALALEIAHRARTAAAARSALSARDVLEFASTSARFGRRAERLRNGWRSLSRRLPGDLVGLVRLFICVSLSMALIAAVLPLIDRH